MVFLSLLSAQEPRYWFEDGFWRMPGPGLKVKALAELGVLYIVKQLLTKFFQEASNLNSGTPFSAFSLMA